MTKNKIAAIVFAILVLCVTCIVRSGIILDKSFLPRFLILTIILLIVFIFKKSKNLFTFSYYEIAFSIFYLWNMFGCFWAIVPSETIFQSQLIFVSFSLFLITKSFIDDNNGFKKIFVKCLIITLNISFILAFLKISSLRFYDPYKIISICANNNLYSGFLLISMPFVINGYSIFKSFWRYFSIFTGILVVFFIIILQSRAGYLGLFSSLMIIILFITIRYRELFNKKNIKWGSISLIILFAGVSIFYLSLDDIRKNYFMSKIPVWNYFHTYEDIQSIKAQRKHLKSNLRQMPEFDFAEDYYENTSLRLIFWKKSETLVRLHPVTGIGAGNWRLAIPSVTYPSNPEHTFKNYTYSQPHNEWIGYLSELGIPGFLLALVVFFSLPLIILKNAVFRKPQPNVVCVIYAAFIIGFYIFASFDFPFHRVEHLITQVSELLKC